MYFHVTKENLLNYQMGSVVAEHQTPNQEVLNSRYVLEQDTLTPQEYWLIPRKWWLHTDMIKKLMTWKLNL